MQITERKIFFLFAALLIAAGLNCSGGPSLASSYDDLLSQAKAAFVEGKLDDAIAKVKELEGLGLEGGCEMAYFIAGNCYEKKDDRKTALEYYARAGGGDFVLADYADFNRARMLDKTGSAEAFSAFEKFMMDHPDSILSLRAMLILAKKTAAAGNRKGAIEDFDLIIYSPEQSALVEEAKYEKAKSLEALGRGKDAAALYFDIIFISPKGPFKINSQSRLDAIVRTKKIPYPRATADEMFERAMSSYDRGDYPSAASGLYKFLKAYPTGTLAARARLSLAVCEYKTGDYRSAYNRFKKIIKSGQTGADEAQFDLSFIYAKWRNLKSTLISLQKVLNNYPGSKFRDDAAYYIAYFHDVNGYHARAQQEYQDFVEKYPESEFCDDALWAMGKYNYLQKNYEKAFEIFGRACELAPEGKFIPYCIFWKGMAAQKLGRRDEAVDAFASLIKLHDHTFPSFRAREKLAELKANNDDIDHSYAVSSSTGVIPAEDEAPNAPQDRSSEKDRDVKSHSAKYYALLSLGLFDEAEDEANYLVSNAPEGEKRKALTLYYTARQRKGEIREPLLFAENMYLDAIQDGDISQFDYMAWQLAFPRGFWVQVLRYSTEFNLDPYLVLAVIREESRFNPKTLSWARAHGLMQIIPPTGKGIARLIGIRPYNRYMLYDPDTNIKMGCYYLSSLLKRFNGNPYYALAAYNGGPLKVKAWLARWGREVGGDVDIDEFVERIPLYETRRYVQKVMNSYNEYKRIYEREEKEGTSPAEG